MAKAATKDVAATQRGPLSSLPKLETEMGRFFDRRWPGLLDWSRLSEMSELQAPSVDVLDQESDIVVRAEVPGFKKEEIDVSVTDNSMTIKASTKSETEKAEEGDYYLKEISQGYVSRTLRLPSEVDGEQAKATYKDGVLEVTVPKVAKAKRQRIEIQS
ncbi:MAG: Hsp20/alpha crystallin family protein [Pseudomonadales bacterium]